nr:30S ribosomal protein S21, chloroplastic [Ipomoea batatas]
MTATTAIPEAVRTGLARSFGSSDSRSVSGNAAIISTSLGARERPYFRQAADLRPLRSTSLPLRERSTILFTISAIARTRASSSVMPHHSRSLVSAAFPSFPSSNDPLFDPYCNVGIIVGEGEPGERVLGRLRREVSRAGIIRECRRRRFFETTQEKKKRKSRDAARRNRMRRPQPRVQQQGIAETRNDEEGYKSDEDNWDISDVEAPYT